MMEIEESAIAKFDENMEAMEEEFFNEAEQQDDLPVEEDVRNLNVFWDKREMDEHKALEHQMQDAMQLIS